MKVNTCNLFESNKVSIHGGKILFKLLFFLAAIYFYTQNTGTIEDYNNFTLNTAFYGGAINIETGNTVEIHNNNYFWQNSAIMGGI